MTVLCATCVAYYSLLCEQAARLGANSSVRSDSEDPDEMTSMMQSNFDVSVSLAGDYDARYSSVGRARPVIIAPHAPTRDGMTPFVYTESLLNSRYLVVMLYQLLLPPSLITTNTTY